MFEDNAPLLSSIAKSLGRILNLGNAVASRLARAGHRQDRLVGVDVDRRFVFSCREIRKIASTDQRIGSTGPSYPGRRELLSWDAQYSLFLARFPDWFRRRVPNSSGDLFDQVRIAGVMVVQFTNNLLVTSNLPFSKSCKPVKKVLYRSSSGPPPHHCLIFEVKDESDRACKSIKREEGRWSAKANLPRLPGTLIFKSNCCQPSTIPASKTSSKP